MNEQLSSALQRHSLSETAWVTLQCIIKFPIKHERDIESILYWFHIFQETSPTVEDVQKALTLLRTRKLIQTFDERQVTEIRQMLAATQPVGMTGHLPGAGNLDLTLDGADVVMDMWKLIRDLQPDDFSFGGGSKIGDSTYRLSYWATKPWGCQEYLNFMVRGGNRVIRVEDGMRQLICEFKTLSIPGQCEKFRDYWWRDPAGGWFITGTYISESRALSRDDYRPTS